MPYAASTRTVYLSERTEQERVAIIKQLSLIVQGVYFTRRLSRETRHFTDRRDELKTLLASLALDPNFTLPAVPPAPAPPGAVGAGE